MKRIIATSIGLITVIVFLTFTHSSISDKSEETDKVTLEEQNDSNGPEENSIGRFFKEQKDAHDNLDDLKPIFETSDVDTPKYKD